MPAFSSQEYLKDSRFDILLLLVWKTNNTIHYFLVKTRIKHVHILTDPSLVVQSGHFMLISASRISTLSISLVSSGFWLWLYLHRCMFSSRTLPTVEPVNQILENLGWPFLLLSPHAGCFWHWLALASEQRLLQACHLIIWRLWWLDLVWGYARHILVGAYWRQF